MSRLLSWIEFPLLRRELLEASLKRRTWALRSLLAGIHAVGFLIYYFSVYSRRGTMRQLSGEGLDAVWIQIMIDLIAIALLVPAMTCSAISGERERQTLGLLLISRIRPGSLIAGKLLSRLLPMTTLLLITLPMLGVSFLLGGVERDDMLTILCLLMTAVIQVASAGILCSSLFHSAPDAFWVTYGLLGAMYFVPGMIVEAIGVPSFSLLPTLSHDKWLFPCMPYLFAFRGVLYGQTSNADAAMSCLPSLVISIGMLFAASSFVVRTGSGNAVETGRLVSGLTRAGWNAARRLAGWPLVQLEHLRDWLWKNGHFLFLKRRSIALEPTQTPVAWREKNATVMSGWRLHGPLLGTILFLQWWSFPETIGTTHQAEEVCVVTDTAVLLIGLMMIAAAGCRTFAAERSRETLDVLLTAPIRNRDLLYQKLSAVNRIRALILTSVLVTGLVHLFVVDMTYLYGRFPVTWRTSFDYVVHHYRNRAWGYLPLNALAALLHAFVYMTMMKWTAVFFSLIFRTPMKAMMGTLVAAICLCSLPAVGTMIPIVLKSLWPAEFPAFLFSSPTIIWGLNETGELRELTLVRRPTLVRELMLTGFAGSRSVPRIPEWALLTINLSIYGTLALMLKGGVLFLLPRILGRRDTDGAPN